MGRAKADPSPVASIILAAGKGTRMTGYTGNKTLLPLVPRESRYRGERPLLVEVLENLPPGPRAIVVHHLADEVRRETELLGVSYIHQQTTNGTGGAVLAAGPFVESTTAERIVITMGDVPLISRVVYRQLLAGLDTHDLVVLAFQTQDRAQYGMLRMDGERVLGIVEWKYWRDWPAERQAALCYCNAGVYAISRAVLLDYLPRLSRRPHVVLKRKGSRTVTFEEYFLTDLVELLADDGRSVGMALAEESEVQGVDTPEALERVQKLYAAREAAAG